MEGLEDEIEEVKLTLERKNITFFKKSITLDRMQLSSALKESLERHICVHACVHGCAHRAPHRGGGSSGTWHPLMAARPQCHPLTGASQGDMERGTNTPGHEHPRTQSRSHPGPQAPGLRMRRGRRVTGQRRVSGRSPGHRAGQRHCQPAVGAACSWPQKVCSCPFLPVHPVHISTHKYMIQHTAEENKALQTVPLLAACLPQEKCKDLLSLK